MKKQHHEAASPQRNAGSFRDPSGFVFMKDGILYRQVNRAYAKTFDKLMESGLYAELAAKGYLVSHEEADIANGATDAYKIIAPERIPFISYPYEWCFSELKDAALLTLKIQQIALRFGMTLKDASAYNIQFKDGRPILIDTLSFEKYEDGMPWVAYRQFCQHFMAPLALMSFKDARLGQLLRSHIDGIPLDLASKLLPRRSWLRPGIFFHIHMLGGRKRRHEVAEKASAPNAPRVSVNRAALDSILDSLKSGVSALTLPAPAPSLMHADRSADVARLIEAVRPKLVWDFGSGKSCGEAEVVVFDADHARAEKRYRRVREEKAKHILPLVMDVANPSPAAGWASAERASFLERGPADLVLALDWIHLVAIGNNVPFGMAAEFLAKAGSAIIIEFIPKADPHVERLLRNRNNIFDTYTQEHFEKEFERHFTIAESLQGSAPGRVIYLMRKK